MNLCQACGVALRTDPHRIEVLRSRTSAGVAYDPVAILWPPRGEGFCVGCADDLEWAIRDAVTPILARRAA